MKDGVCAGIDLVSASGVPEQITIASAGKGGRMTSVAEVVRTRRWGRQIATD